MLVLTLAVTHHFPLPDVVATTALVFFIEDALVNLASSEEKRLKL